MVSALGQGRRSGFGVVSAVAVFVLLLWATAPVCSSAQDLAKRLILKDGSYQLVTKYEVQGDRVRYLSAERGEWEELPASLVDWPATEKFDKDRTTSAIPEATVIDKETEAEREAEEAKLPEVAPGLRLPEDSGIFLLDNYQGQPQLVEMQQAEGEVTRNPRGNIFHVPLASTNAKQSVELEGEHATVNAHSGVPSIYINVEDGAQPPPGQAVASNPSKISLDTPRAQSQPQQPQQPSVPFDRYRIVRIEVKSDKRIVGDIKRQATGKVSQDQPSKDQHTVKTTITSIAGGWLKLTPTEPLTPGEYAIVEVVDKQINLYVWDFGVNPNAPANANPYKPEKPEPKPPESKQP